MTDLYPYSPEDLSRTLPSWLVDECLAAQSQVAHNVCLLLDNTELFISAQRYASSLSRLRTQLDRRTRIDMTALVDAIVRDRPIQAAALFGSAAQRSPMTALQNVLGKQHVPVSTVIRTPGTRDPAQHVSSSISAIAASRPAQGDVIVVVASDHGTITACEHVLRHTGWKIELWAFHGSTSGHLLSLAARYPAQFSVHWLENIMTEQITYTVREWDVARSGFVPMPRTLVLDVALDRAEARTKGEFLRHAVDIVTEFSSLPTMAFWMPQQQAASGSPRSPRKAKETHQLAFVFLATAESSTVWQDLEHRLEELTAIGGKVFDFRTLRPMARADFAVITAHYPGVSDKSTIDTVQ